MSTPGQGTQIPIEFTISGQEDVIAAAIKMQKATREAWLKTLPEPKFIDHFEQSAQRMTDIAAQTGKTIQVNWDKITDESKRAAEFVAELNQKAQLKSYGDIKRTGLGPAGIGITTIDRAVVSQRALKSGTDALAKSIRALPSIGAALGLSQLGLGVERLQAMSRALQALKGIGIGGSAAAAGAGLALIPITYAVKTMMETAKTNAATIESRESNNLKTLEKLSQIVGERRASGELRGPMGDQIAEDIVALSARQYSVQGSNAMVRGPVGQAIQGEIAAVFTRLREATGVAYATEEDAAKEHAKTMGRIEEIRIETERANLKIALESKLKDTTASMEDQVAEAEKFTQRMQGLAVEEADAQKLVLALSESQLQEQLSRTQNDLDARAQVLNSIQEVKNQRLILDAQRDASAERQEAEHVARLDQIRTDHMEREIKETEAFLEEIEKLVDDEEKAADRHEREMERILNARQGELMGLYSAAGSDYRLSGPEQFRAQAGIVRSGFDDGILSNSDAAALQNRLGANPDDVNAQMVSAISEMQTQFGTVAQNIAGGFRNVIGTAVQSVSSGIQKLIGDTEFWSQRLGNIAGPIMGAITASISQMFTTWIVQRGLAAAKNILFSQKEGAADAAAKAPGAMMSSISSWGIAAGVGIAAFLAAMALTGGFRGGGYTGDGGVSEFAGVVHGKEFVFDAPATQAIGRENLEALRASRGARGMGTGGGGPTQISIASFDSRVDARRWAASQDSEVWLADMERKVSHRWRPA
ncbi:MAG: hypothetical protein J0L84_12960 [Verrucomicrobia bacterium]|nr:hypothetical protein [Verrucomicrobiota bacterium]